MEPRAGPEGRDHSERQIRELQALYEISQALCSIHDLDQLLEFAMGRVVALMEVEGSSIILFDEGTQELYFKVANHIQPGVGQRLREVRFPAHVGIAGEVFRKGVSVLVPDVAQNSRFYPGVDAQTGITTKSLLASALKAKDRTLGVVEAINKRHRPFSQEDLRLLEALANPLAVAIENARLIQELRTARERLRAENHYLRETIGQAVRAETIVGESPRMREVYQAFEPILNTSVTVLITGESGTGKELLARVIHAKGPRAKAPFIAVNCSAIPETLLEAELFGYEKGAFTGATRRKPGRFELASGGTLFLDEIGDTSPPIQAKLLRVLQDQKFERLGGIETIVTNARVIVATHRNLETLLREGKFREDLFYRLNVYPIALPPLRERREDLLPLALHFLKKFSSELRKEVAGLSKEAGDLLSQYEWPGNVRELENVIERAVIVCRGDVVTAEDLPVSLRERGKAEPAKRDALAFPPAGIALAPMEKRLIVQALEQAGYNKSKAAKLLGLSRTQLRTRLRNHGLQSGARSPTPRPPSGI
jgi:Nif-specific regulatory protein